MLTSACLMRRVKDKANPCAPLDFSLLIQLHLEVRIGGCTCVAIAINHSLATSYTCNLSSFIMTFIEVGAKIFVQTPSA
jgi:hypothetical protein